MSYLKGTRCERCGGRFLINSFFDKRLKRLLIDGATCQGCFKNMILPDEDYREFTRLHGER